MKALPLLIVALLMAACVTSPTEPRNITFTGDYIDARKDPAAKIWPSYKEMMSVSPALREWGREESAVIAFMVETDGSTSEIQIISTTDREFAEAARESLSHWRYAPPTKDGKPVRVVLEEQFGVRFDHPSKR